MTGAEAEAQLHAKAISADRYLRERVAPGRWDLNYPHLKDLGDALVKRAPSIQGEVFDYGCGGAPYRRLFAHCKRYIAADVEANPAVDRLLKADGTTSEANASYDAVLSTQVLEHVLDAEAYVRECHRILRPGGQLILTTHGMFEEHGCPHDFHRWTSRGLEELVASQGFQIVESLKLTTEMRAAVQLAHHVILHFRSRERPIWHLFMAATRKIYLATALPILNWLADRFPEQAAAPGDHQASLYVCVWVRAVKK